MVSFPKGYIRNITVAACSVKAFWMEVPKQTKQYDDNEVSFHGNKAIDKIHQ